MTVSDGFGHKFWNQFKYLVLFFEIQLFQLNFVDLQIR